MHFANVISSWAWRWNFLFLCDNCIKSIDFPNLHWSSIVHLVFPQYVQMRFLWGCWNLMWILYSKIEMKYITLNGAWLYMASYWKYTGLQILCSFSFSPTNGFMILDVVDFVDVKWNIYFFVFKASAGGNLGYGSCCREVRSDSKESFCFLFSLHSILLIA